MDHKRTQKDKFKHPVILQLMQGHHVTPGAAWPTFRTQFYVTSGWRAHWARQEQGRAVCEMMQSYIYSKEVTSSSLFEQLNSYEGQFVLREFFNEGRGTDVSVTYRLKFLFSLFLWVCVRKLIVMRKTRPNSAGHKTMLTVDPSALWWPQPWNVEDPDLNFPLFLR